TRRGTTRAPRRSRGLPRADLFGRCSATLSDRLEALRREPVCRPGDGDRCDTGAGEVEERRSDGVETELELLDGDREPSLARSIELLGEPVERRESVRRQRGQGARKRCGAEREQDL